MLDLGLLFPDKFQNPLSCFGAKIIHALVNGGEANGVTNLPAVWLVYGQINVTSLVYPTSFEQTLGCIYFERRLILVCAIYRKRGTDVCLEMVAAPFISFAVSRRAYSTE